MQIPFSQNPSDNTKPSRPAWMDDELVQGIPQKKLDFAAQLFSSGHGKSQKEMMRIVLPMMKRAKEENLTFTQAELNTCMQAIKKHSTPEELKEINNMLSKKPRG